MKFGECLLPFN